MTTGALLLAAAAAVAVPDNPAIDPEEHLRVAVEAGRQRVSRRVSEDEFIRMSREPGTIVLDARSREKYEEMHVRGAVHLSFPDFTTDNLARTIPAKTTRVLIYCNNNFSNTRPFPTKAFSAALNLSTFAALYDYGYRNVYELGPLVDIEKAKLEFDGTEAPKAAKTSSRTRDRAR